MRGSVGSRLFGNRQEIMTWLVQRLLESVGSSYRLMEPRIVRRRVERFVTAFLDAAVAEPETFRSFTAAIAKERRIEGFALRDLHGALEALEDAAWMAVALSHTRASELARLSRTLGEGRLGFSSAYRDAPEPDPEVLFRGTDPGPEIS